MNMFSRMRNTGLVPNSFTVVGVLVSAAGLGKLELGRYVHGVVVKSGLNSELIVATAMLNMYAKCGDVLDCYKVFEELNCLDLVPCNAVIAGFVANGLYTESFELFKKFRKGGLVPNTSTMLTLMRSCIGLGFMMLAESVHGLIIKLGLGLDCSVNNAVIGMYSSFLHITAAEKAFQDMECKDIISWSTMMGLLVDLEDATGALRLYTEMRRNGVNVDAVVIVHLILASAVLGHVNMGSGIHAQAIVRGFMCSLRNVASWNAIISGYGINGHGEISVRLYHDMKENEDPDSTTYLAVLNACSHSGLVADGVKIFNQMIQDKEVNPNQEHFGAVHGNLQLAEHAAKNVLEQESGEEVLLLSNAYASVGRFEDAEALRLSIQEKEFIKDPGLSIVKGMHYDCG
ncbi:Pentatricopeptide repeat-containing protein At1g08070, chloroplastic [Linum perenne]